MDRQTQRGDEVVVERYEYDDATVVAADFARADEDLSVDVVEDTAVVVVETAHGTGQRDIDLPAGDAQAFINNGVVTVEVKR